MTLLRHLFLLILFTSQVRCGQEVGTPELDKHLFDSFLPSDSSPDRTEWPPEDNHHQTDPCLTQKEYCHSTEELCLFLEEEVLNGENRCDTPKTTEDGPESIATGLDESKTTEDGPKSAPMTSLPEKEEEGPSKEQLLHKGYSFILPRRPCPKGCYFLPVGQQPKSSKQKGMLPRKPYGNRGHFLHSKKPSSTPQPKVPIPPLKSPPQLRPIYYMKYKPYVYPFLSRPIPKDGPLR